MKKTVRIGTIDTGNGRRASVFCRIEFEDSKLSISGVVGPRPGGNALGSCGQIGMEFAHRVPADNDPRYSEPIRPHKIKFAPGWNTARWFKFLDIWKRWHLNDMRAECEHQRALGWTYKEHSDPVTFKGEACPVCRYEIGSAWLKEDVPAEVIAFLDALPDTDRTPAWI